MVLYGLCKLQDFYWVWKIFTSLSLSFACIQMSTCIAHWLIFDSSLVYVCIRITFDKFITDLINGQLNELISCVYVCLLVCLAGTVIYIQNNL